MARTRTVSVDDLPGVNTDPELNEFITGLLVNAKSDGGDLFARMANVAIDRTVAELRAFCASQHPVAASANGSAHWGGS